MTLIQNAQKKLDELIENIILKGKKPTLLLHSCCAPCSSYVLEYLMPYFEISVFYYNPNISPAEEYNKRLKEQAIFIEKFALNNVIPLISGEYCPAKFEQTAIGLTEEPEGGQRCYRCYELRLEETASLAKKKQFNYFGSTLSVSPYKNARWLNEIGLKLSLKYDIPYLESDFKKKGGYQRSILLSKEYGLYRQNFCGCEYSKRNN